MLFHHILDFYAVQLAEFERRFESEVGIVGVYVRLDEVQIAYDKHTVADGHKIVAVFVDVRLRDRGFEMSDEIFRAILEGDVFVIVVQRHELLRTGRADRFGSGFCGVDDGDFGTRERRIHPFHNGDESASARVHHARFCKDGEHFGGLLQNRFARVDDLAEELLELGITFFGKGGSGFRHNPDHGEDCAFLGFCDRAVRNLRAAFKRRGKRLFVEGNFCVERDGKAFENLRKDDAAVAARAFERAL